MGIRGYQIVKWVQAALLEAVHSISQVVPLIVVDPAKFAFDNDGGLRHLLYVCLWSGALGVSRVVAQIKVVLPTGDEPGVWIDVIKWIQAAILEAIHSVAIIVPLLIIDPMKFNPEESGGISRLLLVCVWSAVLGIFRVFAQIKVKVPTDE